MQDIEIPVDGPVLATVCYVAPPGCEHCQCDHKMVLTYVRSEIKSGCVGKDGCVHIGADEVAAYNYECDDDKIAVPMRFVRYRLGI